MAGIIPWIVVGAAVFSLLLVVGLILVFSRQFKSSGGLAGLQQKAQAMIAQQPALAYPIRTPIGAAATYRTLVWILGAIAVVLIGVGIFFQVREVNRVRLLEREGVVTTATVSGREISESDEGSDTYYVSYTFRVVVDDRWEQIDREESVSYDLYRQSEEGSDIQVVYAPSNPQIARIQAQYVPGRAEYWPIILSGALGLFCLLLVAVFRRQHQNATRLDAEGITTTVTLIDRLESSDSDGTTYYLAYTVPGLGPIRQVVIKHTYDRLHNGDAIRLIYLLDNPQVFRTLWE
ncbi:MAG: DUF3592 domain-containing protein [Anaerolineae bacterium]|nr:DUF3592 domain-containing protein [Anaerolineae bacterium]